MATATLTITVEYDESITDSESVASALDHVLETALSTPGVLEEYGSPTVSEFYVSAPEVR